MAAGMQKTSNGNGRGVDGRPMVQAEKPSSPEAHLKQILFVERRKELEALFPSDAKSIVNRLCAIAVVQYRKLLDNARSTDTIDIKTLVDAVSHAAQLGLEILGDQAYLVPYKGKIQLIVGPGGLITMAHREGIAAVARAVFKGDEFDYNLGTDWVSHKKATSGRRPANNSEFYNDETVERITHVWAKITRSPMRPGDKPLETIDVLTAEDIDYYRGFSQAKTGPWFDNYEGMCRKTALKRVFAYAPKSYILAAALEEDSHGAFVPQARVQIIDEAPPATTVTVPENITSSGGPAQATPPSNRGGASPAGGPARPPRLVDPTTFVFKFGNEQGTPMREIKNLGWYRDAVARSIALPEKAQYRAENEGILATIDAEIRRRSGVVDEGPVNGAAAAAREVDRGDDPNSY